jgi:hypothetical protein
VAKNGFFYKHAENEICFGLELHLDKEIQSVSAHSPQKALNEIGLRGRKTKRKAASTSLRVPCCNSGDSTTTRDPSSLSTPATAMSRRGDWVYENNGG